MVGFTPGMLIRVSSTNKLPNIPFRPADAPPNVDKWIAVKSIATIMWVGFHSPIEENTKERGYSECIVTFKDNSFVIGYFWHALLDFKQTEPATITPWWKAILSK